MKPPEKLYRFHVVNLQAVGDALDETLAAGRRAVALSKTRSIETHARTFAMLLGVWSETRLLKLLYEPDAFSDDERAHAIGANALERWQYVVECAFRRHYGIANGELRPPALPSTAHFRLTTLLAALRDDLGAVITLRNKLAHGQWRFPLNEGLDEIAQPQMDLLRQENLLTLSQKRSLLESLCSVVHDLVVSRATFERDWDHHFRLVEQTRTNIRRKSYDVWSRQISQREARGRTKRTGRAG